VIRGQRRLVQNDTGRDPVFGDVILMTIQLSGLTRDEFYGMEKSTAKAAGCRHLKDGLPQLA